MTASWMCSDTGRRALTNSHGVSAAAAVHIAVGRNVDVQQVATHPAAKRDGRVVAAIPEWLTPGVEPMRSHGGAVR